MCVGVICTADGVCWGYYMCGKHVVCGGVTCTADVVCVVVLHVLQACSVWGCYMCCRHDVCGVSHVLQAWDVWVY